MASQIILNLDQQDEMDTLMGMFWAVQQLMVPNHDLSLVNRDEFCCLLSYFHDRWHKEQDFDAKDMLQRCLQAVIDLTNAEKDLGGVNRDNLSSLLFFLLDRLEKALKGDGHG